MLRLIVIIILALIIGMTYALAQGRWVHQSNLPTRDYVWGQLWFNSPTSGWYTDLIHPRVWHTSNSGASWEPRQLDLEGTNGIFFVNEQRGWVGGMVPGGGIFSTVNGGDDWELQAVGPYGDMFLGSFNDFYFLNDSLGWAVGGEIWSFDDERGIIKRTIMQTRNGGEDWSVILYEEQEFGPPGNPIAIRPFKRVVFSDSLHGIVVPASGGFYVTEDGGESVSDLVLPELYINGLEMTGPNNFLVAGKTGRGRNQNALILKVSDGGAEWDTVYSLRGNDYTYLLRLAMIPGSNEGWAIGSRDRQAPLVLKTQTAGDDWDEAEFPEFSDLQDIFFFDSDNGWIITLFDNTVLRYEPENVVREDWKLHPNAFGLVTIYPNPFNSRTTVCFGLPAPGSVTLSMIDTQGRVMRSLGRNGWYSAGYHRMGLDLNGIPAGSYLIRLEYSGKILTERLVLVR